MMVDGSEAAAALDFLGTISIAAIVALGKLANAFQIVGPAATSLETLIGIKSVRQCLVNYTISSAEFLGDRLDKRLRHLSDAADALRHLTCYRVGRIAELVARCNDEMIAKPIVFVRPDDSR